MYRNQWQDRLGDSAYSGHVPIAANGYQTSSGELPYDSQALANHSEGRDVSPYFRRQRKVCPHAFTEEHQVEEERQSEWCRAPVYAAGGSAAIFELVAGSGLPAEA